MTVSAVIFDCDGTLLDSMDCWYAVQNDIVSEAGVELRTSEIEHLNALTLPEVGVYLHEQHRIGASAQDVVAQINNKILEKYQTAIKPRKGALSFVRTLHENGIVCGVASSTPKYLLQVALEHTGFSDFLKAIVSVEDVGSSKREPVVFDHARELLGSPLDSTWVMEDSYYALRTAINAGYHTIGIYNDDESGTKAQLSEADIFVTEFTELDSKAFIA